MTLPTVKRPHLLRNGLFNRSPIICPLCGRYVACYAGIPVIIDEKASIVDFAHPDCCADAKE
jgi:hypothetical protein